MKKYIFILLLILLLCSASIVLAVQLSFNSGQLSPLMKYRMDTEKHTMGCEEMENVMVKATGMAYKRPGTEFIDDANSTSNVRLIPFEYSDSDAYVLELGHEYIGFLRTVE